MKELYLNNNYRISTDPQCWVLEKSHINKKGQRAWSAHNSTYHATLEQTFNKLTDEIIKDNWCDIEEIKRA